MQLPLAMFAPVMMTIAVAMSATIAVVHKAFRRTSRLFVHVPDRNKK
jgi:hypothetical protein